MLSFPTAEGYGKYTVGGRGGSVYEVTNLNDHGPGSLREGVEASGPRTIVFRVSGTIDLERPLTIRNPYITIAGQTAPGDGITIKRHPLNIGANEVVIRYIRVRLGDEAGRDTDAISSRHQNNIILDHVSASWSIDETMSIYMCENVTIQWCMITESLFMSTHVKGHHGFGGIWGSNYATYHHNLLANHSSRNPRWASGCGYNDYRNNVLYNWGYNSSYGGEKHEKGTDDKGDFVINFANNYYKPGPATQSGKVSYRIVNPGGRGDNDWGKWYVSGNYVEGYEAVSRDNWNGGVQPSGGDKVLPLIRMDKPWDAMKINEQTPVEAFRLVLDHAGCSFPVRDAVDIRIINDVKNGVATYEGKAYKAMGKITNSGKKTGIIDTQSDVGGWPVLKSTAAPVDSDHDGMPDKWEKNYGLNPHDAADRNLKHSSGYTALEVYINSLCGEQVEGTFNK
ncbi:MAG: pectate lyase [Prevotella sp.]|nr:pectate lyase [Prevotella sp.]